MKKEVRLGLCFVLSIFMFMQSVAYAAADQVNSENDAVVLATDLETQNQDEESEITEIEENEAEKTTELEGEDNSIVGKDSSNADNSEIDNAINLIDTSINTFSDGTILEKKLATENSLLEMNVQTKIGAQLGIVTQPLDVTAYYGDSVSFLVEASGEGLSYQWYTSNNGGASWFRCKKYKDFDSNGNSIEKEYVGDTTNKLSMVYTRNIIKNTYKCVVTDSKNKIVTTEIVKIIPGAPVIETQPKATVFYTPSSTIKLYVKGKGIDIQYKWYYSSDKGATWNESTEKGCNSTTLTLSNTKVDNEGDLYYCQITDRYGKKIESNKIKLALSTAAKSPIIINKQPEDLVGYIGEEVSFNVAASGDNLTYQWYTSVDEGQTWLKCKKYTVYDDDGNAEKRSFEGDTSNRLTMIYSKALIYNVYRCEIKDAKNNVLQTNTVRITLGKPVVLDQSDPIVEFTDDEKKNIFVEGKGNYLTYRWYYSADDGDSWVKTFESGCRTSELTIEKLTKQNDGMQYRCELTDFKGEKAISEPIEMVYTAFNSNFNIINDYTILDSYDGQDIYKHDNLINNASIHNGCIEFDLGNISVNPSDVLLFSFSSNANTKCDNLTFTINDTEVSYSFPIQVYEEDYIIPIEGKNSLKTVKLSWESDDILNIGNFQLKNLGSVDIANYQTGIIDRKGTSTVLNIEDGPGYVGTDSLVKGKTLFTVHQGSLVAYSLENPASPAVIAGLTGMGFNTRELALANDGKTLVISARENGVYLVNIEDLYNMYIMKNIPTLGLATGLTVEDNYCFITSRRHGLEIYNISNPYNPVFCSQIDFQQEEFYDCSIDGKYLYVSSWAEKFITVYSLENIYNPTMLSRIQLTGNAAGSVVKDGKLYVATGYNYLNTVSGKNDFNNGMGNGLEIYDVTNPNSPKWLSTSKIDGRYFIRGFDHWRVTVSNGIAYLCSGVNGVYVYDVNDATAPKRIEKITVQVPSTHDRYSRIDNEAYLLTYNQDEYAQSLLTSVSVVDGYIIITSHTGNRYGGFRRLTDKRGLYVVRRDYAKGFDSYNKYKGLNGTNDTKRNSSISIGEYTGVIDKSMPYLYGIAYYNNKIYAAAGENGLLIGDLSMSNVHQMSYTGAVKNVLATDDGYLYVSEEGNGLIIYSITSNNLVEVGRFNPDEKAALVNMHLSNNQNYIFLQKGLYAYYVFDITDRIAPVIAMEGSLGAAYYRNITTDSTDGGIIGINARDEIIFFKTENGLEETVHLKNPYYNENGGITGYGNNVIHINNNGYAYYNPNEITQNTLKTVKKVKINGYTVAGNPKVIGTKLFVCDGVGKKITLIDIADINNPKLISQIDVDGNPDMVYEVGNEILIPLGHGGLLRLSNQSN